VAKQREQEFSEQIAEKFQERWPSGYGESRRKIQRTAPKTTMAEPREQEFSEQIAEKFQERWPSGRRRAPAKGVWGQNLHRGFESLSLRHTTQTSLRRGFVFWTGDDALRVLDPANEGVTHKTMLQYGF